MSPRSPQSITREERRLLLGLAREVAAATLAGTTEEQAERPQVPGLFGGAFVTFWLQGALRGCVGSFAPTQDLAATVEAVTKASLADPRFAGQPIRANELPELTLEISVLSPLTRITDPNLLIPGVHGIMVRRGDASGCFLPRVADEQGWSADEFLSKCCILKAHLEADAWRQPETAVFVFTAECFHDAEPHSCRTTC
jgi:hypothetical protein